MPSSTTEASILTRLFSASLYRDLGTRGQSPLFARLASQSSTLLAAPHQMSVAHAFDLAFATLKQVGSRDEYVYKSAIAHKLLLGRHSLKTATLLSEVRAGASKADIVLLNGTASAYEIKSERDSLARLPLQMQNYLQVFASVSIVTSPTHLRVVESVAPSDVGIIILTRRFSLKVEREAVDNPDRVSPGQILEMLRLSEAAAILKSCGIEVPEVPNTRIRKELNAIFNQLDPALVHRRMVATIKKSRSQSGLDSFLRHIPRSLTTAALTVQSSRAREDKMRSALSTPLSVAMNWS